MRGLSTRSPLRDRGHAGRARPRESNSPRTNPLRALQRALRPGERSTANVHLRLSALCAYTQHVLRRAACDELLRYSARMGRLKLKVPKLTWKGKLDKLRTIILAGAPFDEVDPDVIKAFDLMRRHCRDQLAESDADEYMRVVGQLPTIFNTLWEPYSNGKGNKELLFGWDLQAAFYGVDGKPWWILKATFVRSWPNEEAIRRIEEAASYFGAHVTLDRIMNHTDRLEAGYDGNESEAFAFMWWTWINQHPLLETHIRKEPFDMRVVPEGSFVPPGYERLERAH
jgi:hypothetical protein